ncbi:class I SAM-dependent methyltransferase [Paraflavitalea soli]|uniref:Class I SAM-dependent methyltransferase n=1 Tax=Paraflavitalea soli TaxID=2315862 RepID=A0A3B7MJB7_9BACT|nr:class I SAM-dependent methyltransferase [Paraflavitalea soli]AXY74522.1 class I SAM-dependent methyltransferase [Paraflavitalea soli]
MDTRQAYNSWAAQYDTNLNKTRDLEAQALRATLAPIPMEHYLEIGCGTGKNTEWLVTRAQAITAVDLSEAMLAKAKAKINSPTVQFIQADITTPWTFTQGLYDVVGFSLVLEHIENLPAVFEKVAAVLKPGGYVYIGELHPFKQYSGSKARFETEAGIQVVECFTHHISDFIDAGKKHGLLLADMEEYFDNGDRQEIPRILTLLLKKG